MKTIPSGSARERLLAAANELFYEEGVQAVGIDRVIERANVAKASLYNAFGSKEELVRAYLETRREARQQRVLARVAESPTPRGKLLAVFDAQVDAVARGGYRGCAFVRASSGEPEPGVRDVCDDARAWLRALFVEHATAAGIADPPRIAAALALLYDGASVAVQMDRDASAPLLARALAEQIIEAAMPSGRARPAVVGKVRTKR